MDIINVNDVCLTLGKTEILKHINVSFEEGKIHGLIGRNGSGKTMLMKCICGSVSYTHLRAHETRARTLTSRKIWVSLLKHLGLYRITVDTKISNFLRVLTTRSAKMR